MAEEPPAENAPRGALPAITDILSRYLGSGSRVDVEDVDPTTSETLRRIVERRQNHERYRLEGEVARGGQGAVLRVFDEDLRRELAMKVVLGHEELERPETPPRPSSPRVDSRSLGRFLEEAQVTGQLDHPGIVPVHELGLDENGRVYFTMKLVKGLDLKQVYELARRGEEGWTLTRALGVLLKVCEAMSYAHAKGVIHRDLKPSNVMVGRYGEVFVMDWGLARILGQEDSRDVRIRPQATTVSLDTVHHHHGSADAPLITMDGDVVGTPAYMSPEQAAGDLERMGPPSDVYSMGAMLYQLLGGAMPYVPEGKHVSNYAVWGMVQQGPPRPVYELAPHVPAELVAICEKAMARDPRSRYPDMRELGEDLRAYLEHRVVHAYETGAVAELRKWVSRNRGLALASAAAGVLAVGGLGAVGWVEARGRRAAEAERRVAEANEERAEVAAAEALRQEGIARRERDNVLRLSAHQRLVELQEEAEELWPPHPDLVPAYESWLARAADLVGSERDELTFARERRDELRARALPETPEERAAARRSHPLFDELTEFRRQRDALARAEAVRAGEAEPEEHVLQPGELPADSTALGSWAWQLTGPEREVFGREAEGLAIARLAVERADDPAEAGRTRTVLAWAALANGLDEEALEAAWGAVDVAPASEKERNEEELTRIEEATVAAEAGAAVEQLARLDARIAELEAAVDFRADWSFASAEDRWWHEQLTRTIAELEALADPGSGLIDGIAPGAGWGVARRLAFARTLTERSLTGSEAKRRWDDAITAVADRARFPDYAGLTLSPQLGLLPLGPDPRSGLWEFANLATGEAPERGADGELALTEESAVVLALLPGGTFWMGAQSRFLDRPNHDHLARPDEGPVHRVSLAPFFIAKHELTQAQWERLTGENPSTYAAGGHWGGHRVTRLHPVEQVSWIEADRALRRIGLILPTEAQWEYAARGGRGSSWWPGDELAGLNGVANVSDAAAIRMNAPWPSDPEIDDGFGVHAPVGTFAPNPFGLHEVHGNNLEWCRDHWANYNVRPGPNDGLREPPFKQGRVPRGGAFAFPALTARSSHRIVWEEDFRANFIGLRAARTLDP